MSQIKYIENINKRVQKKIDSLREEANDAFLSWADTGYQKYIKKQERLESEADELESFIHPELRVREAWNKANKLENENYQLKLLLKSVQNVLEDEMKYDFPDCHATRRLEDIVNKFKLEYANK